MDKEYKYDVAISFAEEDRNAALALALALEIKGCRKVYYYPDKIKETTGENLKAILSKTYAKDAKYAIVLLSRSYFKKEFAQIELAAIHERIMNKPECVYVIAVKLEKDLSLKNHDFLDRLIYMAWNYKPKKVANALLRKLGQKITPNEKNNIKTTKIILKNYNDGGYVKSQKNEFTGKVK